jgi:sugar lactone lactonase YvrE
LLALAATAIQAPAQSSYTPYAFANFAGMPGVPGSADGTGSAARFNAPNGVAVDSAGNVYVADYSNDTIRKVTPGGVVTTLAGLAGSPGGADGTGGAARFNAPNGVAVDGAGNLYVADKGNDTIRTVTPSGVVTTLAGLAGNPGSADGMGSAAQFNNPTGVALDSAGNVYVADYHNDTIRKITPAGVVTTLAGLAGNPGSADGTGSQARFYNPGGVAVDATGNVYVADQFNQTIRKITPAGVVTTLAGQVETAGSADGTGSAARFYFPTAVAVDSAGNVYVGDQSNDTIRRVTPGGVVTTLAGLGGNPGSADGIGSQARFAMPSGVALDSAGYLYVADNGNDRISKGAPTNPLSEGLLAYYPLTDDGKDQSGHGLDLTLNNVLFSTVGPAGGDVRPAASFDGQSSYAIVNQALITGQSNWTWAAWVYSPQPGIENSSLQSLYMEGLQGGGTCFGIDIFGGMLTFSAYNIALPGNWAGGSVPNVLTNGWNHLAFTLAGGGVGSGTLSIFFNGVLTNSSAFQSVAPGDSSHRLGVVGNGWTQGNPNDTTAPWKGSMADLRFYNRAISAAEVQQLYIFGAAACNPHAATAAATVVNGFVVGAIITDGGCGYTNAPAVLLQGGGGTGATAAAVVNNGVVVNIIITDAGIGYTNAPAVDVAPPFDLAPQITGQPQNLTVFAGSNAEFSVSATGIQPMTFQWACDGTNIAAATNANLILTNVQFEQGGKYAVAITNSAGYAISSNATLAVLSAPQILSQPASQIGYWDRGIAMQVTAEGTPPLSYQWYFDGLPISWGTNATLSFSNLALTDAGAYSVQVTNLYGRVLSDSATLFVNPAGVSLGLYAGLTISGAVGKNFGIQYTTSLSGTNTWTTITNFTLTQPVQLWVDTSVNVSGGTVRYYRVVAVP